MQGDVSFTFLDRIEEVELNIVDRRWQSALALALTLPDICGERCWQLRCEYLHQNKGFLNDENNIHFHLGLNCGMSSLSVGQYEHAGEQNRYSYRHRTVLSENVQGSKELL